ncbi:MAG: transposase [Saprospiraceae bacterium]|nr:transposase [Saprospiraceae bacterium]
MLSHLIVSKFIDHLPFYRQIQIFKREFDWNVSASTINDWFVACCTLIEPLYEELKDKYYQVDIYKLMNLQLKY